MATILRIALAVVLAFCVRTAAADPIRIEHPDQLCDEVMRSLAKSGSAEAANIIAKTVGQPTAADALQKTLQIFDGKNFDFVKTVIDKEYNNALRQIVVYAHIEGLGFVYFRFNFKMTSTGWILANFNLKNEINELFPKDFTDR